jgi:transposase
MEWDCCLAPFGIQDTADSDLSLFFGTSRETSDFVVDCLELWWETNRKKKYSHIEELVINIDNGPSQKSNRSQFIMRIVEFSRKIRLPIHLVYYPPYHSKYNPIEHSFGVLERYWNGEILNTVEAVLKTASNMTVKGKHPSVRLLDKEYGLGKKLSKKELESYEPSFVRSPHLPKWDVLVVP